MKNIKIGDFIVHALTAIVCISFISFAVIGAVIDMPIWINVFGGFCGGICGILAATTIIHAYTHRNPSNVGAKTANKIITFAQESPELNTNAERAAFLLAMVDIFNTAAKKYTAPQTVKHGRWEYDENAVDFNIGGWRCSECGVRNNNLPTDRLNPYLFQGSSYCPQCGAKMDGTEQNND